MVFACHARVDEAIDSFIASLDDGADGDQDHDTRLRLKNLETHVRVLPPVSMGKGHSLAKCERLNTHQSHQTLISATNYIKLF